MASISSDDDFEYDSDMSDPSTIALSGWNPDLVVTFGPNPAGNRFGTAAYIRSVFIPSRAPGTASTSTKKQGAPNVPSIARRRRRSSTPDAIQPQNTAKRFRETTASEHSTSSSDEDAKRPSLTPTTTYKSINADSQDQKKLSTPPTITYRPIQADNQEVQDLIEFYYEQEMPGNKDLYNFLSTGAPNTVEMAQAMYAAVEKKAVALVTAEAHIPRDYILTEVGKSNLKTLLTTEWWNDDVAALVEFYVLLFESGRAVEREDWVVDKLRSAQKGMFPGKADEGLDLLECVDWKLGMLV